MIENATAEYLREVKKVARERPGFDLIRGYPIDEDPFGIMENDAVILGSEEEWIVVSKNNVKDLSKMR